MTYSKILGTGSYTPERTLTNTELEQLVDTSDEWIQSRTGIVSRQIVVDENTSDLAYQAAERAIKDAGVDKGDIDLFIVATVTPDMPFPGVSQILQRRLGLNTITAFDLNAACSGFVYALNVADKMIRSGAYRLALIVGAETLTKITDYTDRNTCVLFGDAAGAMVLGQSDTPMIKDVVTYANGDIEGHLTMQGYPIKENFKTPEQPRPFLYMNGAEVFKFATTALPKTILTLLERNGMVLDDLSLIVAHQANRRIIDKAARTLKYPMEKMYMNIERYGNTSAASVPLAIDEAIKEGALKKGDTFITVAFGAGLTWGGALITL